MPQLHVLMESRKELKIKDPISGKKNDPFYLALLDLVIFYFLKNGIHHHFSPRFQRIPGMLSKQANPRIWGFISSTLELPSLHVLGNLPSGVPPHLLLCQCSADGFHTSPHLKELLGVGMNFAAVVSGIFGALSIGWWMDGLGLMVKMGRFLRNPSCLIQAIRCWKEQKTSSPRNRVVFAKKLWLIFWKKRGWKPWQL